MRLGYSPTTAHILDVDAGFKLAVDLGLDFVELAYDFQEMLPSSQPVSRVLELKKATGLEVTVHLPYVELNLASVIPAVRKTSLERMNAALEYSLQVGALCGVAHTGFVPEAHPLIIQAAKNYLADSLHQLQPSPVVVVLENTKLSSHDLLQGLELEQYRSLGDFACCLDVGHALIEGGEAQIAQYWQGLSRIEHLHLHDNFADKDLHLPCGEGQIDWQGQRAYLQAFTATACLEIAGGEDAVARAVQFIRKLLA